MSVDRVLIVGGGIAGLATAAGLRRAGIGCEVVEQAPAWAPVGAGIVMSVNAMAVLRRLDVADDVAARGFALGRGALTDARGRDLSATDLELLREEYGPTIALHRAELHHALLAAAGDTPVALGTSVEKLEPAGDRVDAVLTDGRQERYDLVIGADGLRSKVRELVFGDVPIAYSGYTCWRLAVEAPVERVELREMWGRGQRFGVVPIGPERLYGYAVANAPRGRADPPEGRLERFRARFAAFGGQVPRILAALSSPRWYRGRVALIGDAAHAMTPNMGQGAAMALEDSAVLVEELQRGGPLESRLAAWRSRRQDRVRWVQDQSRRIGRVGQLENALGCAARDAVLRALPNRAAAGALRRLASQPI